MVRLHFPQASDSPTGRTPLSLRVVLEPRPGGGGSVAVRYKHRAEALEPAAFAAHRMAGAWIETDDERAARQLREAFGEDAPVRLIAAGTGAIS